jgi:tRNA (guanine37-N1)-methyltransferase
LSSSITASNLPNSVSKLLEKDSEVKLVSHTLHLNYDSYQAEDILRRLLPTNIPIPKPVETVGHIAYIKISDHHIPYSTMIGQVYLDKTGKETVVGINGTSYHVLAGKLETELVLKEKDCVFHYNFVQDTKAASLCHEHERLISKFKKGEEIFISAGYAGHLAIKAAKAGCKVIVCENDGYDTVISNVLCNKVADRVTVLKGDVVDILKEIVQERESLEDMQTQELYGLLKNPPISRLPKLDIKHIVLYDKDSSYHLASEMLGLFRGATLNSIPLIHIYTESQADNPREDLIKKLKIAWLHKIKDSHIQEVHYVRERLYCVSVKLAKSVAYSEEELLVSEGTVSGEEVVTNSTDFLLASMKRDMEFMQRSIRESQNLQTSLLVSHMSSIVLSQSLKRRYGEASPEKKMKTG